MVAEQSPIEHAETPRVFHGATSTTPAPGPKRLVMALLVAVIYGADQYTKHLAETHLTVGDPVPVIDGVLWWSLHYNPGAAFSMGTHSTVALSILSLVVFAVLIAVVIPRVRRWWPAIGVSWLLAGVAGNLTDRLFREPGPLLGHVVDFIAVRWFAIFNIADMAITGAAILLVIWSFWTDRRR